MIISELIEILKDKKEKYGDIDVCLPRISWGTQDGYIDKDDLKYVKEENCICFTDDF